MAGRRHGRETASFVQNRKLALELGQKINSTKSINDNHNAGGAAAGDKSGEQKL